MPADEVGVDLAPVRPSQLSQPPAVHTGVGGFAPGARGAAGVTAGHHGTVGAGPFADDGAITAQIIDAAQIDELLALLGHDQHAASAPGPAGAHSAHAAHAAHAAHGALAYRSSGGANGAVGAQASPSAVLGELGRPVAIGTALVDLMRLASDHRGEHVKAFVMRTGNERDRIVMITEDWSRLVGEARHDPAGVAKTITGALDRAIAKAYAGEQPPVRADVRVLADGRIAISLVPLRTMKVSVAAIATNAGFELFAKPAPAAAVNVALHAHAPASARASDPRRAPSTDRVLDTGTGSHGPDHPASVVNAMVDSVADRIDDVRTAFAGAFAAAGRTITAPLAALRAGRQSAVAVALLVTVAGIALAFARDFDTLGVIAGGALVVAAVTVMAVAAGTLVRGGSGRQTGG